MNTVQVPSERLQERRVRIRILGHPQLPLLCMPESSRSYDGCASFIRDESGEALCGAFRVYLKEADDPHWQDEWHVRCQECLDSEEHN